VTINFIAVANNKFWQNYDLPVEKQFYFILCTETIHCHNTSRLAATLKNAIKSPRATSRFKIELQSDVSEALPASIIRVVLCMSLIYSIYALSCTAIGQWD
jgi:hypothetical protein